MKIEVLGTGCAKCKRLYANAEQAISDLGIDAELVKIEDINDILDYGVMVTPAIVVDGEVKSAGKIPGVEEIKAWLK